MNPARDAEMRRFRDAMESAIADWSRRQITGAKPESSIAVTADSKPGATIVPNKKTLWRAGR